jgi:acyl-CoA reductase-like NAD-dependent aldehyde dehydrogenase
VSAATLWIGGAWESAERTFERTDPAVPERVTGRFARATPADVGRAFAAAHAAQPAWAETPAQARGELLRRVADLLERDCEAATERLIADIGKARRDARAEVLRGVAILRYYAGEVLQAHGETYPSADPATLLLTLEEPVGVVGAITPWNFPVAIPLWKLAPALGFGNAVVWKPAEAAAGSAVLLARLCDAAGLPPGVLNLVTGSGRELGQALTGAPQLRALTFTGSDAVGLGLREAVARTTVKLQLELGGKNPAIVLADADLSDAAEQIARGAMGSTGQRCTATSRVYVEQSAYDELLALLIERVASMRVGDPYDEATDVGPPASEQQRRTIESYLALARAGEATIAYGGTWDGVFLAPTVLVDVDPASALLREEIFGPVVCVVRVAGFDEAVRQANDTPFGLSSAVFTRDLGTALAFARRAEAGLVHVNRETAGVEPHVPFGGLKGSSTMQREQGTAARQFFTNSKTVYVRTPAPAPA